jgi:pyrimidine oxygenase
MHDEAQSMRRFGLPSDDGGKDLGVFLPVASGGWILSRNAPKIDGSYAYNREVARLADGMGLDFIMSMAKYRGYGGDTEHWRHALDATVTMAALAEVTRSSKIWTTVHTILQNPAWVAKMIATLDQVSEGRAGLNVVTGSYRGEFAQMGAWPEGVDHDARYDLATEWIRAIKALWTQERVTQAGRYFTLDDCMSDPKPATRPFLVCAGTSERGMSFTAQEMDALFLSGGDAAALRKASDAAKAVAAAHGRRIRTYSMMTVLTAATAAEAMATARHYRDGLDEGALAGMMRAYGFLDAEIGRENAFVEKARSTFMTPHVEGTPADVAMRLGDLLEESGIDGLMLIFPDYLAGLPVFGAEILPVLRARFPARVAAHA